MLIHRRHTSMEIVQKYKGTAERKMPAIVPMSSLAADMLKSVQGELDSRGIATGCDMDTTMVRPIHMSDGINGSSTVSSKKVYPNAPCPCGSGRSIRNAVVELVHKHIIYPNELENGTIMEQEFTLNKSHNPSEHFIQCKKCVRGDFS